MKKYLAGIVLFVMFGSAAQAALLSRAGGQAYYDDVLNITWLANANLAATQQFGIIGINATGTMPWEKTGEWIAALNTANYLGVSNWRLPTVTDTGTPGCNFALTGTDCGFNVDPATGEMAHLYYTTLGNTAYYDAGGNPTGCSDYSPYCLANAGPFSGLQPYLYWSGTTDGINSIQAWNFIFYEGSQLTDSKYVNAHAWAVRSGDIAAVPAPGALWLFATAIVALGGRLQRRLV